MDYFVLLYSITFFVIGASVGSFLNVVTDRLPKGKNFFISRSYCESCNKTLKSYDLIPLISYLILRGKCRFCGKKIPLRLFVVEFLTGVTLLYSLIVASIFIPIFLIDASLGIIPDELVVVLIAIVAGYLLLFDGQSFMNHLISGFGLFASFLGLYFITKGGGMGFGDVKLSFALGFFLGFPNVLVGVYLAFLTGALVAIILVILGKKRLRKDTISFGPFLVASAFFTFLYGEQIVRFVAGYFNL